MTSEQIMLKLQQEYADRREENLRLFEARQQQACAACPGLEELIIRRHAAVMQGVRSSLLSRQKNPNANAALPGLMADMNRQIAHKLTEGGFSSDYLQPVYTCAVCRDEGYVYDPSRRMCDCFRTEYNRRLLAESGVTGESCTFEKFDETLFDDTRDEHGMSQRSRALAVRNLCLAYADKFPQTAVHNLMLMGKSGLGKTFLLQCIAHRVAQHGHLPVYTSAYRLLETARRAYMDNNSEIMSTFMNAPLLLIDDLGTEPMLNNVTVTQLFNLLNERQMAGRHTVISTNLSMDDMMDRYTERITSRLKDASSWYKLDLIGADIRRNLKRKADKA